MCPKSCCTCCGREVAERHGRPDKNALSIWLSEATEIGLGTICGGVTWRFVVQSESAKAHEYGNVGVGLGPIEGT